jgi:hypothetical protein
MEMPEKYFKLFEKQCGNCEHFDKERSPEGFFCPAYPRGIPEAIVFYEIKHDKELNGQAGIFIYTPIQ